MTKQKQVFHDKLKTEIAYLHKYSDLLILYKLEIELRCILFPLIILEMFLELDWSPPVVNSIDWT
jgi:hypothetical protein